MAAKNRSNLDSPNRLLAKLNMADAHAWYRNESQQVAEPACRKVLMDMVESLDVFIKWPERAILLWPGCDRNTKYHSYSDLIKHLAREQRITLDGRTNGPAIAAYRLAGGTRPTRYGSRNCWSVHHLYSGKFPYVNQTETLHAAKNSNHFTQSAGLVAVHPLADQACDEFPFFAWLLRAMAFQKFGYDPDKVFSELDHDQFGFVGQSPLVFPIDSPPV
jgi:hypothetical protein